MRRDLLAGVIVTTVFVAIGVVAIFALVLRSRHDDSSGESGSGAPIVAALVSRDGRHLFVTAMTPACQLPRLSAQEDTRSVTLRFTSEPYSGACTELGGPGRASATVVLKAALFGRSLSDAATGKPVRYFDGRTLWQVGYLPPGWRLDRNLPSAGGSTSGSGLTWLREYATESAVMHITQSTGPLGIPRGGTRVATAVVAGQPVPVYELFHGYLAEWSIGAAHFTLDVASTGTGRQAMPVPTVVRVLAGMHR